MQDSFFDFADEQVLEEGYWPAFLESWSLQLRNDTKMLPQLNSSFFFSASIVYGFISLGGVWDTVISLGENVVRDNRPTTLSGGILKSKSDLA